MLGLEVICSIINMFCCVNSQNVYLKAIFSQCERVGSRVQIVLIDPLCFCKDTEAGSLYSV